MINLFKKIINSLNRQPKSILLVSIIIGVFVTLLLANPITGLLFSGKSFYGRNFFYQSLFVIFFVLIFSSILFVIITTLMKNNWFAQQTNANYRILIPLFTVGIGVASIFIINNIISSIDTKTWIFGNVYDIPRYVPEGIDFRVGIYQPAANLFRGKTLQDVWNNSTTISSYLPFLTAFGILFLPFSENTGYLVYVGLLILANIASLALITIMIKKSFLDKSGIDKPIAIFSAFIIFCSILFYTISSYPFSFSIERGNCDIFALLFVILTFWVLSRKEDKVWSQVILLSIATHIKIYPAIVFLLLFKKHGKKMILPTIIVNLFLLFILGPNNLQAFFHNMFSGFGAGQIFIWIGNHSGYSFAHNILEYYFPNQLGQFTKAYYLFTLIPIIIWGIATFILFKKEYSFQKGILFLMVSIPVMDLIPTVSHDYKLIILSSAVIILLASIIRCIVQEPKNVDYLHIIVILVILFFVGRSFVFFGESNYYVFASKYVWSLALQGLMLWHIIRIQKSVLIR